MFNFNTGQAPSWPGWAPQPAMQPADPFVATRSTQGAAGMPQPAAMPQVQPGAYMDPYLQPPAAGQIPGQPFAQFGAQRTPWWGYSLPQMGNQPTPFNEQQPINPVGDVLNPGQAGAPQQPAPAAQPDPFVPNYGKYANILNANESTAGADPWALMAQHQRLGGDRDAWRKVQMAQNPRLAALASL